MKLFILRTEKIYGPYPIAQVKQLLTEGRLVKEDNASSDKKEWKELSYFFQHLEAQSVNKPPQNATSKTPTKPISNSKSKAQKKPLVKEGKPPSSKIKSVPKSVVKTPRKDTQPPDLKKRKKTLLLLSSGLTLVSVILVTIWILTQDSSTESFEKLVDIKNFNNSESNSVIDKVDISSNQEPALPKEILDTNFKTLSVLVIVLSFLFLVIDTTNFRA